MMVVKRALRPVLSLVAGTLLLSCASPGTKSSDRYRMPAGNLSGIDGSVRARLDAFARDLETRRRDRILDHFDPVHFEAQLRLANETAKVRPEEYIDRYVIETLSLYGENRVSSMDEILSVRYISAQHVEGGVLRVEFEAALRSGRLVRGSFFVNAAAKIYGAFG